MRRREFIALLGGTAAWPLAARAQQASMPVVGVLSPRSPAVDAPLIAMILQGLKSTGFFEGRNITLDYRWADGQYDQLTALAADLVRRQVRTRPIARPASMPAAFSRAKSPAICRSNCRPSSSW